MDALELLLSRCESEAERAFAHGAGEYCTSTSATLYVESGRVVFDEQCRRWFIDQQVKVAGYRLDFLVVPDFPWPMRWKGYAIEIDGHAWHERTHAEAAQQRRRDRELARDHGIYTIRFAAIEVLDDAEAVFSEVEWTLEAMIIDDHWFAEDHVRGLKGEGG